MQLKYSVLQYATFNTSHMYLWTVQMHYVQWNGEVIYKNAPSTDITE